ncbi:MAG TPA: YheC/YheD family protein, partial [Desulfobacteria bacterium]|nr:YheC/YheD family protein [Desulfobacteria bacterium]
FFHSITDLCLKTAAALEKQFGLLGKLGIDVVVDSVGKPWLIEANGNPGRVCPKVQAEFPDWNVQVYEHPIAYAQYLAGFSNPK